jgi:hypothetical protein|tara:strand:+ start:1811 stop:2122 length:312 start_codon:yes stop_codon:yes gene_type:complete
MKKKQNLENFIDEAIENIRSDRAVTSHLLTELLQQMAKDKGLSTIQQCGMIASKYVETLQRSNEQMVKLASLVQKKESKSDGLSSIEKEEIYDLLNSEDKEDG